MNLTEFESVVGEALDRLPIEFADLMSNVTIQVEDRPDARTMADVGLDPRSDTLFGLYTGVPSTNGVAGTAMCFRTSSCSTGSLYSPSAATAAG